MRILFTKYKKAFDNFDANGIASNYKIPCSVSDADGSLVFDNKEGLIDKFSSNCKFLHSMGYVGSEFNILSEMSMGSNAKSLNIGWRVNLKSNIVEFRCLYVCHLEEEQWKIFSANVYDVSFD